MTILVSMVYLNRGLNKSEEVRGGQRRSGMSEEVKGGWRQSRVKGDQRISVEIRGGQRKLGKRR